jgi:competence/damage-inducible protein CinA-like protein
MNAVILSTGDELVLGQTVDTNSAWLSQQLAAIGCAVAAHVTIADDQAVIQRAISEAAATADFLIVTGGLGPTLDDLTRQAIAGVLNVPLELSESALAQITEYFRSRGRPMAAINRVQAMLPRGANLIENKHGTAPGIDAIYKTGTHSCRIFCTPGVPSEMMHMFHRSIAPQLSAAGGGGVILSRTLHTFGIGESIIGEMLGPLMDRTRNPSVGTTVSGFGVSLRINARFSDRNAAERELDRTSKECSAVLGALIYGQDEQTLAGIVGELLLSAPDGPRSVAVAESLTGGLVAKMLTDVPGSSRYFQRGWVTYSNEAKTQMLGVDPDLFTRHGAVSEPVVLAMAAGARRQSKADYALALSGVAGPDGGSPEKPVGTVCIALEHPTGALARTFRLVGDRFAIRDRSAKTALSLLRYQLLGISSPF